MLFFHVLVVVPNTYRNNFSAYRYAGNADVINNYTSGERKLSSASNASNINTMIPNKSSDQVDSRLITSQYHTQMNDARTNYNAYPRAQHLGLPDTSSLYDRQNRQQTPSPVRTSSPNIFENREFGGTINDIKTRFTTSPIKYQNTTNQQEYPLLQNIKGVDEAEIRRNKKG